MLEKLYESECEGTISIERKPQVNIWYGVACDTFKVWNRVDSGDVSNSHTLLHNLTPNSLRFEKIGNNHQFFQPEEPYTLLLPKTVRLELRTTAGGPLKLLETKIDGNFRLRETDIGFRKCSRELIDELNRIFSLCVNEKSEAASISELCNDIAGVCSRQFGLTIDGLEKRSLHQTKMLLLRSLIEENVMSEFPSLTTLAKKTGTTVSTIKRHFKNEFGVTMYQYYLQKKMEIARRLLEKDGLSVNDTAETLHYASVSNFIETFRKYYGRTPGSVKAK